MNTQKIIMIVLAISLIVTLQYLVLDKWMTSMDENTSQNIQNAYDQGIIDTISAIYNESENCQGVPITVGNLTKTIFDVSCLNIEKP